MKRRGRHQNVVFEPHFGSRASLGHLLRVLDGRRDGMGDQTSITAGGFISICHLPGDHDNKNKDHCQCCDCDQHDVRHVSVNVSKSSMTMMVRTYDISVAIMCMHVLQMYAKYCRNSHKFEGRA